MRIVPRTDKLQRFFALSGPDKWMLLHASVWLALARLMLLFLPFNKLAAKLPGKQGTTTVGVNTELFERIGYAVRAAANNVPWRSDCFVQGIAGWMLLKHHGYNGTIHLGVEKTDEDSLAGHAWLTCDDTVITGGADRYRYAEIHRLGG
jgi:hypothetical protein